MMMTCRRQIARAPDRAPSRLTPPHPALLCSVPGVYYGGFKLGGQLHYVSRPHNWKTVCIVELDGVYS